MIKNYRQIAKSGPRVLWVGAGKSQGGGQSVFCISPIFDKMKIERSVPLTFTDAIPKASDRISISAEG